MCRWAGRLDGRRWKSLPIPFLKLMRPSHEREGREDDRGLSRPKKV